MSGDTFAREIGDALEAALIENIDHMEGSVTFSELAAAQREKIRPILALQFAVMGGHFLPSTQIMAEALLQLNTGMPWNNAGVLAQNRAYTDAECLRAILLARPADPVPVPAPAPGTVGSHFTPCQNAAILRALNMAEGWFTANERFFALPVGDTHAAIRDALAAVGVRS